MNTTEARHSSSGDNHPHRRPLPRKRWRARRLIASRSGRWWMHSRMSYSATTTLQPSAASGRSSARRVLRRASGDYARPRRAAAHDQAHRTMPRYASSCASRGSPILRGRRGICHQVLSEEAVVLPGSLSWARIRTRRTTAGWVRSARASGAARWRRCGRRPTAGQVPETMRIELDGELPPWVTAKDFALRVIGDLGRTAASTP